MSTFIWAPILFQRYQTRLGSPLIGNINHDLISFHLNKEIAQDCVEWRNAIKAFRHGANRSNIGKHWR